MERQWARGLPRPQKGVVGLGYWLAPADRGQGHATDAIRLVTAWALGRGGIDRVEAWVEVGNESSERVLLTCEFSLEGRLRSLLCVGDRRADALVCSRTRIDA